jgi:hypothetical protein
MVTPFFRGARFCVFFFSLSLLVGAAYADIHKCTDHTTGAVSYFPSGKEGCVNMRTGVTCDATCEDSGKQQEQNETKKLVERAGQLNRQYPGHCSTIAGDVPLCVPRVGMRLDDLNVRLLRLESAGYLEGKAGMQNRWTNKTCTVMASPAGIITSVNCS